MRFQPLAFQRIAAACVQPHEYANGFKVFNQHCNHKGAGNVLTQHQQIKPDVHKFTMLAGGALAMMASTSGPSNKKTAKGTADAYPFFLLQVHEQTTAPCCAMYVCMHVCMYVFSSVSVGLGSVWDSERVNQNLPHFPRRTGAMSSRLTGGAAVQ